MSDIPKFNNWHEADFWMHTAVCPGGSFQAADRLLDIFRERAADLLTPDLMARMDVASRRGWDFEQKFSQDAKVYVAAAARGATMHVEEDEHAMASALEKVLALVEGDDKGTDKTDEPDSEALSP